MMSNETVLRHFLAGWATRDVDAMVACFAVDGILDNVPDNAPLNGHAPIRAWLEKCFAHLTRIDAEILNLAINDDWILCERLDDHIIGDRSFKLPVMNATYFVDGKIQIYRDYYCRQTVKELGMIG